MLKEERNDFNSISLSITNFFALRASLPVVDVRSENEFCEGHIPSAINIPLLNNEDRVLVGTDYKKKGKAQAIKTGFRLVGPRLENLINQAERVAVNKELIVHCWRGGMRSGNFCGFISMAGIKSYQLEGGYKAYRRQAMASFNHPFRFIVIGGRTGSGKSEILRMLGKMGEQIIDLERLANHKGSVFGGLMLGPQPTTEQFQNNLFEEIMKLDLSKPIWIEDESIAIGKIFLPEPFWRTKVNAPVVQIKLDKEKRVKRLVQEYGTAQKDEFLEAMEKIKHKLGGQNFNLAREQWLTGDLPASIETLLRYYDKAYNAGLEKKAERTLSVIEWNGKDAGACAMDLIQQTAMTVNSPTNG